MKLGSLDFNKSKFIIFIIFINLIFFLITYNNPWTLDDFTYFHGVKLYNLINDNLISFEAFVFKSNYALVNEDRYLPVFFFLNQILPTSGIVFHLVIVLFHTLASIVIFFIGKKIFKKSYYALLLSLFYALNYSVSIKSLSWNIFYAHILAAMLGLFSIFLIIKYFESSKKNKFLILFSILLSTLSSLTTESGLIFPILGFFLILFLFSRKQMIFKLVIFITPVLFFIILVFLNSGKFLPLLEKRMAQNDQESRSISLTEIDKSKIYYNRSTYAPRNTKTYLLRGFDNLMVSINFSSYEKIIKYFDKDQKMKSNIKENLYLYIFFFIFLLIIFIFILLKELIKINDLKNIKFSIIIYLIIFLIYTVIFFRRDINFGLSFCSALLLTSLIKNLSVNKSLFKINLILISFFLPSILYAITSFSYWGEAWGPKSEMIKNSKYIIEKTKKGQIINNLEESTDYKNLYYFYNFEKYKDYLKGKYKNKSFIDFQKSLEKDTELFKK